MISHHSFSVRVATELASIEQAILLEHIAFLSQSNCYSSVKRSVRAMRITYPYITERCIRLSLSRLEAAGCIEVESGQADDPTKTYIITAKGWELLGHKPDQIYDNNKENIGFVIAKTLKPYFDKFFASRDKVFVDKNSNVLPQALFTISDGDICALSKALQLVKINSDICQLIYEFVVYASGVGKCYQNTIDLKTHFFNWARKNDQIKQKNDTIKRSAL